MKRIDDAFNPHDPDPALSATDYEWSTIANALRIAAFAYEREAREGSDASGEPAEWSALRAADARALADKISKEAGLWGLNK